jgi:hypothetical protein
LVAHQGRSGLNHLQDAVGRLTTNVDSKKQQAAALEKDMEELKNKKTRD